MNKTYIKLEKTVYVEFRINSPDQNIRDIFNEYSGFMSTHMDLPEESAFQMSFHTHSAHDMSIVGDVEESIRSAGYKRIS